MDISRPCPIYHKYITCSRSDPKCIGLVCCIGCSSSIISQVPYLSCFSHSKNKLPTLTPGPRYSHLALWWKMKLWKRLKVHKTSEIVPRKCIWHWFSCEIGFISALVSEIFHESLSWRTVNVTNCDLVFYKANFQQTQIVGNNCRLIQDIAQITNKVCLRKWHTFKSVICCVKLFRNYACRSTTYVSNDFIGVISPELTKIWTIKTCPSFRHIVHWIASIWMVIRVGEMHQCLSGDKSGWNGVHQCLSGDKSGWNRVHQCLSGDKSGWNRVHQCLSGDKSGWNGVHQCLSGDKSGWNRVHQCLSGDNNLRYIYMNKSLLTKKTDLLKKMMLNFYRKK